MEPRKGAEGEDPAVGGHEPVARAVGVGDEGLDGALSFMPPMEP